VSVDLLKAAAQRLLAAERPGHLLMCSSCVSKFSIPGHSTYAATKAAQNAVCQAMRFELRSKRIDVSSVHPITTTTEFFDVSADLSGRTRPADGLPEHAQGLFVQPPERVARAIVRCLRRPRPEVWTSHIVRGFAAVGTFFPRVGDYLIGRQVREEAERHASSSEDRPRSHTRSLRHRRL
jgi:short-subunit dehydrogenase